MCGRYVIKTSTPEIARLLGADGVLANTPARYNVAPTQNVPACRLGDDHERQLVQLRWGLIPAWSKDPKKSPYSTINARGETAHQRPAFRAAFKSRRCIMPADGYYEWRKAGKIKQPYYIRGVDGMPLWFAGLWERWRGGEDERIESCSIVTTAGNADVADVHDRMPVLFDDAACARWLAPDTSANDLREMLVPAPAGTLTYSMVSTYVNNVRNDGPQCIEALPSPS